jgi:pimeloyl-ACP methyl ester carboxylesterase
MSMDVLPESWYGWRKQIPALVEAGCRVLVPDQRGYNLSDKPKDVKSYHMSSLVEDILGLVNALEYEKVNLVGHDWGIDFLLDTISKQVIR